MGMCQGCGIVFNANDMIDGYCNRCIWNEIGKKERLSEEQSKPEKTTSSVFAFNFIPKVIAFIVFWMAVVWLFSISEYWVGILSVWGVAYGIYCTITSCYLKK